MFCLARRKVRPMNRKKGLALLTILIVTFILVGVCISQENQAETLTTPAKLKPPTVISDKFSLWQEPLFFRGAAVHPYTPYGEEEGRIYITKQDFQALRAKGANVVSLNYPGPFGVSPPYGLDEEALKYLDDAINWSQEVGLYVIIHFRNGPGKSEETFYGEEGREDELIWYSEEAKIKWIEMWQFVAQRYKDKLHIVGYNLMVEPHPEDTVQQKPLNAQVWIKLAKRITTSIRKVDKDTPIIVGATVWSNAIAFAELKPTGDERTIYSFHMYEPYEFTHQGLEWAGKGGVSGLTYPGMIPSDLYEETRYWNKALIEEFLKPVLTFRDENNVPIFVGEFGCNRRIPSCAAYLKDLLEIFEENGFSYTHYIWNIDDDFDYQKEVSTDERVAESRYMRLFKKYWGKNEYIDLPR